jgi:hypothetical protein
VAQPLLRLFHLLYHLVEADSKSSDLPRAGYGYFLVILALSYLLNSFCDALDRAIDRACQQDGDYE